MTRCCVPLCLLPVALVVACANPSGFGAEVAKTEHGVPIKVVAQRNCSCFAEPDPNSEKRPIQMFEFFYVLKPENGGQGNLKNDYYCVATGKSASDRFGWIHKDDVVEWLHREALKLVSQERRQLAEFYNTKEYVEQAYDSSQPPPPKLSTEFPDDRQEDTRKLMPLLDQSSMELDGDDVDVFQMAYLNASHAAVGARATRNGKDMTTDTATDTSLDCVFVLDVTQSMQPFINATKDVVAEVAQQMAGTFEETLQELRQDPKVNLPAEVDIPLRFGLVCYRDVLQNKPRSEWPPYWKIVEVTCNLEEGSSNAAFLEKLGPVKEATDSSEDVPEDVLAGLKMAMSGDVRWNPMGFKIIILLGDASAHTNKTGVKNQEKLDIPAVRNQLQPLGEKNVDKNIVLHAVRVINPAYPSDHETCKNHFEGLAHGRYPGEYFEFDGDRAGANEFAREIVPKILKQYRAAMDARYRGRVDPDTPGREYFEAFARTQFGPVMKAEGGPEGPHFTSGWACSMDRSGYKMFEPHVLVDHRQLDFFTGGIRLLVNALGAAGQPREKDPEEVLKRLQHYCVQIGYGEQLDENMPFSELAEWVMGLPMRTPAFDFSIAKLTAMPQPQYDNWERQVMGHLQNLQTRYLNKEDEWFYLAKRTSRAAKHCFVRMNDLP